MRWLSGLFLLCFATVPLRAETVLYVSLHDEGKISVYAVGADGTLTRRAEVKVPGGPAALTTSPDRRFLFASLRPEGKLASFRIDPKSGGLTLVNVVPAGADPAHLSTDRNGRFLLTAYYVAAKVTVHRIGPNGALSEKPVQSVPTADKAHAIVPDPSNKFVFVPHTGPNVIFQFALDAATGRLRPGAVPRLFTPKGTGPRHLAFHPTKPIAYVINEQGGSVTAYALDGKAGTLSPLQTVSTLPAGFRGVNATAEVKVHPSGRFLYGSNRGHDSIALFAIEGNGKLSPLGHAPTEKAPRSFDLDPSGRFLYAAGEGSGRLACYRVDAKTGKLTRFATLEAGKVPWWALAVELPGK
jgi:6-phosphogluconolactonase